MADGRIIRVSEKRYPVEPAGKYNEGMKRYDTTITTPGLPGCV
jgi:hypothetical protein